MEKPVFLQPKYVKLYKGIAVTVGVYLVFRYALSLFAPFVAAYLLAGAVRPVVLFLKRKCHVPTGVGATGTLLGLVVALGSGIFFLGKLLVEQVVRFVQNYGGYRDAAMGAATRFCSRVDGWFSLSAGTAEELMQTGLARIGETVDKEVLPAMSKHSIEALGTFAYAVAGAIIAFVAAVLLLSNREKYAKDGLYFSFENEILTSIFVTNEKYKTKDGLYVGYRFPESELNIDSTRIEKNGISFFIENYEIVGILVAQNNNEVE